MDLNLQPLATTCFVSGEPFREGDRVVSRLLRGATLEILRYDVLEAHVPELAAEGQMVCSWVQNFKPRPKGENADRALKMTAENLFITLADPAHEPDVETVRLVQFLALMLERKRMLRPKGKTTDGERLVYEHAKSKQLFEVPAGEFTPAFFMAVQAQLNVLVGGSSAEVSAAPVSEEITDTAASSAGGQA